MNINQTYIVNLINSAQWDRALEDTYWLFEYLMKSHDFDKALVFLMLFRSDLLLGKNGDAEEKARAKELALEHFSSLQQEVLEVEKAKKLSEDAEGSDIKSES